MYETWGQREGNESYQCESGKSKPTRLLNEAAESTQLFAAKKVRWVEWRHTWRQCYFGRCPVPNRMLWRCVAKVAVQNWMMRGDDLFKEFVFLNVLLSFSLGQFSLLLAAFCSQNLWFACFLLHFGVARVAGPNWMLSSCVAKIAVPNRMLSSCNIRFPCQFILEYN